jgi:hypothetical protein
MRLLADRQSHGILVRLFWDEAAAPESDVVVEYRDRNEDVAYTLYPPREQALDAFHHPNSYLDWARECSSKKGRPLSWKEGDPTRQSAPS